VLEYIAPEENLAEVGGFKNLKAWLAKRTKAFAPEAKQFGISFPRGLLLLGVQGGGKTLAARAIARDWGLPLLKMETGRLYDKYIDESEKNLEKALRTAEHMAPRHSNTAMSLSSRSRMTPSKLSCPCHWPSTSLICSETPVLNERSRTARRKQISACTVKRLCARCSAQMSAKLSLRRRLHTSASSPSPTSLGELGAAVGELPWREGVERLEERGDQGTEGFDAIGGRHEDDDGNRKSGEILLVL
jgi:hypothetical protein